MDDFTRHINEMNDYLQSFRKNNRVLSDNWCDNQAERFSQSILDGMTNSSQGFIQLMEEGRSGIGSIISQLEDMEKELRHLESTKWTAP